MEIWERCGNNIQRSRIRDAGEVYEIYGRCREIRRRYKEIRKGNKEILRRWGEIDGRYR
jgi:hypothetical protein